VDEFFVASLGKYKDKPLVAVDRGTVEADQPDTAKADAEKFAGLLNLLKSKLQKEVKDVRLSSRLKQSAAVLVADEHGPSAHMERLMARLGRGEELPPSQRILEVNPAHPLVAALRDLADKDAADPRIENFGRLIYEQAVIAEGSRLPDPAGFAQRLNDLMTREITAK
jgi:molecular chaperone HtpG